MHPSAYRPAVIRTRFIEYLNILIFACETKLYHAHSTNTDTTDFHDCILYFHGNFLALHQRNTNNNSFLVYQLLIVLIHKFLSSLDHLTP